MNFFLPEIVICGLSVVKRVNGSSNMPLCSEKMKLHFDTEAECSKDT